MITNIRIDAISPHPDNPRKDLGDLTELAASIKAQGILQNLTVVPQLAMKPGYCTSCKIYNGVVGKCREGHDLHGRPPCSKWDVRDDFVFTVVIGHRRLAAAKLAGLEDVPCVISDMDLKTQVATMLLENMQRSDLTIWEQAQGLQMMLDFGETIGDVAKLTGFSYSTISRRVKLLELDGDKFKKSVARGATLQDYAELDKISDIKTRNEVLEHIGTSNFQWKLKQAIDQEKQEKFKAALIAELETFATRVEKTDGLRQVAWSNAYSGTKIERPADAGETKYFFTVNYNITLYKELSGDDPRGAAGPSIEEQRQQQERRQKLDEVSKRAYALRQDFVRNYAGAKKYTGNIMEFAFKAMLAGDFDYDLPEDMCKLLGIEFPDPEDEDECNDEEVLAEAAVLEAFQASPERVLMVAAYCGLDSENSKYQNWRGEFAPNSALDALYDALERLGYETSAEERALRDGTHELYGRDEVTP